MTKNEAIKNAIGEDGYYLNQIATMFGALIDIKSDNILMDEELKTILEEYYQRLHEIGNNLRKVTMK